MSDAEGLRALPAVDRVIDALGDVGAPPLVAEAARRAVDAARGRVQAGESAPSFDDIVWAARELLGKGARGLLHPVVNATGVLIHTNLGRVPLGKRQLDAIVHVAGAYSNLEYDIEAGRRGSRYTHAASLLTTLTGADGAVVVNNNAAAVLISLAALCSGREVIISRGELIEIGGEFRIPDVMEVSGARLVEVGTTNRTHLGDYERAITQDTAAILKVHPSNYRVVGFTASVPERDLGRMAKGRGVTFICDLGSGLIGTSDDPDWTRAEPRVAEALEAGADVVTFSGDKLLGGPQAGVIVGRGECIEKIARHPLMRAVRPDKMTLAALQATLESYLAGEAAELPLWQMARASSESLEKRAEELARALSSQISASGTKVEAVPTEAVAGGGSLPGAEVASWAVAIMDPERSADELSRALRLGDPPVIARIEDDRLLLDLRTVPPADDPTLLSALSYLFR